MPVSAQTLRLLMEAGIEGDELLAIVESIDAEQTPAARSSSAVRQARYRARKKAESVTGDVTRDVTESVTPVTPLTRVDEKQPNIDTKSPSKKTTPTRDAAEFRSELAGDLDADRIEALVKHRRTKKAQVTAHAARLFKRDAAACGLSIADAADTCISRNWITVKPEWLQRPHARGSPASRPSPLDHFRNLARETDGHDREDSSNRRDWDDAPGVPVLTIEHQRR